MVHTRVEKNGGEMTEPRDGALSGRRGTPAGGEAHCDFRFTAGLAQADAPHTDSSGPGATDPRSEATVHNATALMAPAVQR